MSYVNKTSKQTTLFVSQHLNFLSTELKEKDSQKTTLLLHWCPTSLGSPNHSWGIGSGSPSHSCKSAGSRSGKEDRLVKPHRKKIIKIKVPIVPKSGCQFDCFYSPHYCGQCQCSQLQGAAPHTGLLHTPLPHPHSWHWMSRSVSCHHQGRLPSCHWGPKEKEIQNKETPND